MPSPRSFSSRSRAALAAALALSAVAPPAAPLSAQGTRPAVALDVRVDGALYRSQLGDDACTARCAALRAALADSVRGVFDRSFGFLEWRRAPAPDTLTVAWVNAETQTGKLALTLRGRHARRGTRTTYVPFESFSAIADRPAAEWQQVDRLSAAWSARLRAILARPSESQGIIGSLLWQIPLAERTGVTLGTAPDVLVGVGPRALRADPARNPAFVVRMHVVDPADAAPTTARQDTTEMSLAGCSRTGDGARYRCRVDLLVYPERTPPDTVRGAADLATLARRARQQPVTLHLWTYYPVDPADDAPLRRPPE